jgi:branched-chain amino acid aminotransferase
VSDPVYHVDGKLLPAGEASVDVRDRGFTYGDAVFETMRAYGGEPFAFEAHVNRLRRSAETLGFEQVLPPTDDIHDRITETLAANDLADAYVRFSVSRGVQPGKLTPDPRVDPTIVVVVDGLPRGGLDGERVWDGPATLQTVGTRRPPESALPSGAKTHNYLTGILARRELQETASEGYDPDEALLRDTDGAVCEGATSNVFFVSDGTLKTPTAELPLLPGVTRGVVLDIADGESFPVEAGRYTVGELHDADELFLTNSTWELRPVTSVDGREKPVGPITRLCQRLFDERVERVHYDP